MTTAQDSPRTRQTDRARREALRPLVHEATEALVAAEPGSTHESAQALARARAAAEEHDGTGGRAAAGIRTAWAYLGAGQVEDAFLALECARDALVGR